MEKTITAYCPETHKDETVTLTYQELNQTQTLHTSYLAVGFRCAHSGICSISSTECPIYLSNRHI